MEFRSEFSHELDITASITKPPKDLHVMVRVVRDCGVIQTELGSIDFQKGQRFMVRRADIEHLIAQGHLEQLQAKCKQTENTLGSLLMLSSRFTLFS
jgi:GINS complex subunit 1